MAENSKIQWCDHTFNPWIGCTKVSPGCKHCYAEALMDKRFGRVKWGPAGKRERTSEKNWELPLKWNRRARRAHERHRVFCASLADVFEERDELIRWRNDLFDLIERTPYLDWLILTKRPEHAARYMEKWLPTSRWGSVWVGTSVENQEQADLRIPELLKVGTDVRFLSCEPLIGPVDLSELRGIDWVICGGETGQNAREMDLGWARAMRDQCESQNVPFFYKSRGGASKMADHELLDGKRHNEYPSL